MLIDARSITQIGRAHRQFAPAQLSHNIARLYRELEPETRQGAEMLASTLS